MSFTFNYNTTVVIGIDLSREFQRPLLTSTVNDGMILVEATSCREACFECSGKTIKMLYKRTRGRCFVIGVNLSQLIAHLIHMRELNARCQLVSLCTRSSMSIKSLIREERSKLADNYFVNLNVLLNEVSFQHF